MLDKFEDIDREYQSNAKILYGLLHARFIKDARGMLQMVAKYNNKDFGVCPRSYCDLNPVLPCGLYDEYDKDNVRLYCANCNDIYLPTKQMFKKLDGAYFGTAFPHLLFLNVPKLLKPKNNSSMAISREYTPKIYGFKLHKKWHKVSLQSLDDHSHMMEIYGIKGYGKDDNNNEQKEGEQNDTKEEDEGDQRSKQNEIELKMEIMNQKKEIQRLKMLLNKKDNANNNRSSKPKMINGYEQEHKIEDIKDVKSDLDILRDKMSNFMMNYDKDNINKIWSDSKENLLNVNEEIKTMNTNIIKFKEYMDEINIYIDSLKKNNNNTDK